MMKIFDKKSLIINGADYLNIRPLSQDDEFRLLKEIRDSLSPVLKTRFWFYIKDRRFKLSRPNSNDVLIWAE